MKRFVITLSIIVCLQTFCYATNENMPDSTKIEYQVCGNDTVYYTKSSINSRTIKCGLKQYEDDFLEATYCAQ